MGSFGGLSAGKVRGRKREMVQGSRSMVGRNKINKRMLRIV